MATVMAASQPFQSPKRKRGSTDSTPQSPQPPKVLPKLSMDADNLHSEPVETGSPRSVVAGHLEQLDIQGPWVRQLSFKDAGRSRKRFAQMTPDPDQISDLQVHLQSSLREQSPVLDHHPVLASTEQPPDEPMSTGSDSPSSPRITCKPRARSRSPPLDGDPEDNPLTWHESEITGHEPNDPNDDGYGINGIGFKPTPSIAWSRSQRRKQQIAEYRSREAREARQRRSEKRRNGSNDRVEDFGVGEQAKPKVRFDDVLMDQS